MRCKTVTELILVASVSAHFVVEGHISVHLSHHGIHCKTNWQICPPTLRQHDNSPIEH